MLLISWYYLISTHRVERKSWRVHKEIREVDLLLEHGTVSAEEEYQIVDPGTASCAITAEAC
jgi:hypothetical protein